MTSPQHESPAATALRLSPLRKLLYAATLFGLFFGTSELAVRYLLKPPATTQPAVGERQFVAWLDHLSSSPGAAQPLYRSDRRLLWSLTPATTIDSYNYHHAEGGLRTPIRIRINAAGYRGAPYAPKRAPGELRVLCLGDSNFFGYPLDDDFAFPRRLEGVLTAAAPVAAPQVVNGGVPGFTSEQGRRLWQDRFAAADFDIVLLSFLNNDAWKQPVADKELLRSYASPLFPLAELLKNLRLYTTMAALFGRAPDAAQYVARVPLADFEQNYRQLIAAARQRQAAVMILDYRAYPAYEPYSQALRALARSEQVPYLAVADEIEAHFHLPELQQRYPELAARIEQRWGRATLAERPYLWVYAEYAPEHLNELGVVWLAERVGHALVNLGQTGSH